MLLTILVLLLQLRWLKSDVMKRSSLENDGAAEPAADDAKYVPCTTLDDCFAKFTQREEVTSVA